MAEEATPKDPMRTAYSNATSRLREKYRGEFNQFMKEETKALGIEWKPRPSAREKAAQTLDALLAEHPDLIDEIASRVTPEGQQQAS